MMSIRASISERVRVPAIGTSPYFGKSAQSLEVKSMGAVHKASTFKIRFGAGFQIAQGSHDSLGVPVGNLIRLATEAESRNASAL